MATTPESYDRHFDLREHLARIDKLVGQKGQALPETQLAPIVFFAAGSGAVFFAAGAIFAKLLLLR